MSRSLVVYFSVSGNTRIIAEEIKMATGADIVEIEPLVPYKEGYNELVKKAKREIADGYRPEIVPIDISGYDTIFVGTPNWWSTLAPPVSTFLEGNDFSGKTVASFITHGGGGRGHADKDLERMCNADRFAPMLSILGGAVEKARILAWIDDNGLDE